MKDETGTERPLILLTNDDGIKSDGLWAAAEALLPLGEVLVVVPDRQWSGAGRSIPYDVTGRVSPSNRKVSGEEVTAYAVDASPTLAVVFGVVELSPRRPSLVVSGINFGANVGRDVAMYSGTIGAALEGGALGIPAMAVSLQMRDYRGDQTADYTGATAFAQRVARRLLSHGLPQDVDALSVSVPADATPSSPWRITRLSCEGVEWRSPDRANGQVLPVLRLVEDRRRIEPDSDVQAVVLDHVVSITPLSLNPTSRTDLAAMGQALRVDTEPQR